MKVNIKKSLPVFVYLFDVIVCGSADVANTIEGSYWDK